MHAAPLRGAARRRQIDNQSIALTAIEVSEGVALAIGFRLRGRRRCALVDADPVALDTSSAPTWATVARTTLLPLSSPSRISTWTTRHDPEAESSHGTSSTRSARPPTVRIGPKAAFRLQLPAWPEERDPKIVAKTIRAVRSTSPSTSHEPLNGSCHRRGVPRSSRPRSVLVAQELHAEMPSLGVDGSGARPLTLHNGCLVLKRALVALLAALSLLATASAGAEWQSTQAAGATARAYAIRVVVPDQPGAATPTVSAPDDAVVFSGSFNYGERPEATIVSYRLGERERFSCFRHRGERDRLRGGQRPERLRRRDHRRERRCAGARGSACGCCEGRHRRARSSPDWSPSASR